jgi:hypothetical protein
MATYSTRVQDYLGQGSFDGLPDPTTFQTLIAQGITAWYYATDVNTLYIWNSDTLRWDAAEFGGGGGVGVLPTMTPATGVAANTPQNVTIPHNGLTQTQVWVFINTVKQSPSDYSLAGDVVTVTPNSVGDKIEIYSPVGGTVVSPPVSGGGSGWDFDPPLAASFGSSFGGIALDVYADDSDIGLTMQLPANHTGYVGHAKAVPAATDFTVTTRLRSNGLALNTANVSLVLGEATLNHFLGFGWDSRQEVHMLLYGLTGYDGFEVIQPAQAIEWFRYIYVNSTGIVTVQFSRDGKLWTTFTTYNYKSHFGADPAFVGLAMSTENYGYELCLSVPYWSDTL